jgi:hypothetical protein
MKDSKQNGVRRLELRPQQAVSVEAAPGTIVRCLDGTIWLTQEAVPHDHILIPGTRFVSESDGKIVLTSFDGAAAAQVYAPGCGADPARAGFGVQLDPGVVARVEREALRARQREIGRLLRKLGAFIASAWHTLKAEVGRRKSEGSTPVAKHNRAAAVH